MKISACMIVKNEEELLPGCLESIKDFVDEIIVVDTGSTDRTKEVAEEHNAKIFDIEWDDDFSAARNFAMSKATGDWLFTIDADEYIDKEDIKVFKKMLPNIEQDAIAITVYNLYGANRVPRGQFEQCRFFRKSSDFKYVGRVHNRPRVNGDKIILLPFRLYHIGYDLPLEVMIEKDKRRVKMCKRWTEEEPNDATSWYYYANALRTIGGKPNLKAFDEIIGILKKGLVVSHENGNDNFNIRVQTLNNLAWLNYVQRNFDEAILYGMKALAAKPDYLDAILVVGLANALSVSAIEGEEYLKRYLREVDAYKVSSEFDCIVMEHANDRKLAYKMLIDIENWKETQSK